ncbi:MAG: GNAT family N-acetyltransferase [Clostridia bacterium]|nr:GNAT family N-acetyltransferase [Clostridia bacterium]
MIRNFNGKDIEEVIRLWNEVTPHSIIDNRTFVKNILLDPNYDERGFFLYEYEGEIVGFILAIIRRVPVDNGGKLDTDKGYINAIGVKCNQKYTSVAIDSLISAAEEYVYGFGDRRISVGGYTPNYFYPGIDSERAIILEALKEHGYTEGASHRSIRLDLSKYEYPEELRLLREERERDGFVFTTLSERYVTSLLSAYLPGWVHRFRRQLLETMDYSKYHIILKDGDVIGCTVYGDPYSAPERFGPFGVNEKFRGLGLGKILLAETLLSMKQDGLDFAWAQSTPMAGPATSIYDRAGFTTYRVFVSFSK